MTRGQELKWPRRSSTRARPKIPPLVPAKPNSLQEGPVPVGVVPSLMEGGTLHVGLKTPPAPFLGTSHGHPPCLLSLPPETQPMTVVPAWRPCWKGGLTLLGPGIGQALQTGNLPLPRGLITGTTPLPAAGPGANGVPSPNKLLDKTTFYLPTLANIPSKDLAGQI